jgi:hypothetical protein
MPVSIQEKVVLDVIKTESIPQLSESEVSKYDVSIETCPVASRYTTVSLQVIIGFRES